MPDFVVKVAQYVEEVAEICVVAPDATTARAIVKDSIERNMLDEEYEYDWADGDGIHFGGIEILEVNQER